MRIKNVVFVILILIGGCNGDEPFNPSIDYGYDYFPIATGKYWMYDVTEIVYDASGPDTSRFQLRETIIDSTYSDGHLFEIERSKRATSLDNWEVDSIWTARMNDRFVVIAENNVAFQKLVFPIQDGTSWDGNAFNIGDEATYEMELIPTDSTDFLKVIISDLPENIVKVDERYEYYVKGVGLVSKEYNSVNFCTVDCDFPGQILSGRILEQYLIEYGKN